MIWNYIFKNVTRKITEIWEKFILRSPDSKSWKIKKSAKVKIYQQKPTSILKSIPTPILIFYISLHRKIPIPKFDYPFMQRELLLCILTVWENWFILRAGMVAKQGFCQIFQCFAVYRNVDVHVINFMSCMHIFHLFNSSIKKHPINNN